MVCRERGWEDRQERAQKRRQELIERANRAAQANALGQQIQTEALPVVQVQPKPAPADPFEVRCQARCAHGCWLVPAPVAGKLLTVAAAVYFVCPEI